MTQSINNLIPTEYHNSLTATYSVEDNKLRIYPEERFPDEILQIVKKHGFKWAPRQKLFVAPKWTPAREDLCTLLGGEIEAESTTMLERAEAKEIRLRYLAQKRAEQSNAFIDAAKSISDNIPFGQPILIGHHSERRARKDRERINSAHEKAAKAANAVPYWNYKAEGVINHAERKNRSDVRERRIKKLLTELRDLQRGRNDAQKALKIWMNNTSDEDTHKLCGYSGTLSGYGDYTALKEGKITAKECREKNIKRLNNIINGPTRQRWINHVLGRLGYERAMLGSVAEYKGELTNIIIQGFARTHGADKPKAQKTASGFILRSPCDLPKHIKPDAGSLELTNEGWIKLMKASGYEVIIKERRKTTSTKAKNPLVNLSIKEAQKLQDLWNLRIERACYKDIYKKYKINEITEISQAKYSANSKGTYSHCETIPLSGDGKSPRKHYCREAGKMIFKEEPVCRIRIYTGNSEFYKAKSIIHINDKPTQAAPLDWEAIDHELKITEEDKKYREELEKAISAREQRFSRAN